MMACSYLGLGVQQAYTAVLATTDPNLRNYGSPAVATGRTAPNRFQGLTYGAHDCSDCSYESGRRAEEVCALIPEIVCVKTLQLCTPGWCTGLGLTHLNAVEDETNQ